MRQIDRQSDGVFEAILGKIGDIVYGDRRRSQTCLEGAIVVEVGPEGDVFFAAGRTGAARVAGGQLDAYDADQRVVVGVEADAFELFVAGVAVGGKKLANDVANIRSEERRVGKECRL